MDGREGLVVADPTEKDSTSRSEYRSTICSFFDSIRKQGQHYHHLSAKTEACLGFFWNGFKPSLQEYKWKYYTLSNTHSFFLCKCFKCFEHFWFGIFKQTLLVWQNLKISLQKIPAVGQHHYIIQRDRMREKEIKASALVYGSFTRCKTVKKKKSSALTVACLVDSSCWRSSS